MDNDQKDNVSSGLSSSLMDGEPTNPISQTPGEAAANPTPTSTQTVPKKSSKKIIAMVLIVLILAAVAYFVYAKGNNTANKSNSVLVPAKSTVIKAKAVDVDATTKEVDKSLNTVSDTKDFDNNDISDAALGL